MATTPQPDTVNVAHGTTLVRFGYVVPASWQGAFSALQDVSYPAGTVATLTGTVDVPSTFSVAAGYALPPGVTLQTLSTTQCRLNLTNATVQGDYVFAIEATAL